MAGSIIRSNALIMGTPIMKWSAELTDTFGGQANYSWVQREDLKVNANYSGPWIVRTAKAAFGLTSVPHKTEDYGHSMTVHFPSINSVLFLTLDS